jgi:hypothetical protein
MLKRANPDQGAMPSLRWNVEDGTCDLPTKLGLIDDERTVVEDRCEAGYCIWSLSLCADGSAQSGTDIQAQGWTQK